MAGKRYRAPVDLTNEQADMLRHLDTDWEARSVSYIKDQIRWREELIERYQAEIYAYRTQLNEPE